MLLTPIEELTIGVVALHGELQLAGGPYVEPPHCRALADKPTP
jgi:hypothetical protein